MVITCIDLKICTDFVIFGNKNYLVMIMYYYYCHYTIQFATNEVRSVSDMHA